MRSLYLIASKHNEIQKVPLQLYNINLLLGLLLTKNLKFDGFNPHKLGLDLPNNKMNSLLLHAYEKKYYFRLSSLNLDGCFFLKFCHVNGSFEI